jgi:predicted kinase
VRVIIFIGLQATGKTTFYRENFLKTHIRINLDMLKTRYRENILIQACLTTKQPFVVDNTNPTLADRERYLIPAKQAKFETIGYYFTPDLEECKLRNKRRIDREKIPLVGILSTYKKIVPPTHAEGFDKLYRVSLISLEESCEKTRARNLNLTNSNNNIIETKFIVEPILHEI